MHVFFHVTERAELSLFPHPPAYHPHPISLSKETLLRKEDLHQFRLMEEVEKEGGIVTQRDLARRLNVSLGLTNAFLKRIVRKGYFKITTVPGRTVRYILTPKGFAEKSRLTMEYIRYSLAHYQEIRHRTRLLANVLREKNIQRVAMVGTGELAELFYLSLREAAIEVMVVVSLGAEEGFFLGYPIMSPDSLRESSADAICVVDMDEEHFALFLSRAGELGLPKDKIIRVGANSGMEKAPTGKTAAVGSPSESHHR